MPGRISNSPARVLRTNSRSTRKSTSDDIILDQLPKSRLRRGSATKAQLLIDEDCLINSPVDSGGNSKRRGSRSRSNTPCAANKENSSVDILREGSITPGKRKGKQQENDDSLKMEVSPAKILKTCNGISVNATANMSPTVRLSKLSLDSPKLHATSPLRVMNGYQERTKRRSLFSPTKKGLDIDDISGMLLSENKTNICNDVNNSPAKVKSDTDIFFKKPVGTPSKRRGALSSPNSKNSKSPLKGLGLTGDKLEDLLCSPVKNESPVKQRNSVGRPKRSPLKVTNSGDIESLFCSPVKPISPPKKAKTSDNSTKKQSPLKISQCADLEDLLCSPTKNISPVKLPSTKKIEPEEISNPLPMRSPRKPMTPVKKNGITGRANLFSSPPPKDRVAVGAKESLGTGTDLGINKVDLTQLHLAKGALHTGTPDQLLCRSEQVNTMSQWLDEHLMNKKPGSLYVSGAPGTGKTATLTHLLKTKTSDYKSVFLNCMVLKSSIQIFKEVAKQLNPKTTAKSEKEALKEIEKFTTGKGPMVLLVLDEIDQLESKNQDVLYTIFEWPALKGSRLSLVGIANTLDLTDRVLPRLQIKECYKPTLIHYPPYSKQQIIEIITKRLATCGVDKDVVTTRAITYLAGKISTLSGDIRKALDVCRRALEQAETNARKQSILKPRAFGSPLTSPQKGYKGPRPVAAKAGQVDLPQIMKVINEVYGSKIMKSMSMGGNGGGLPTQQKILMASLLLLVKRGTSKEVTVGKLVQTYAKVCKKKGMAGSDELECIGMVQGLEARGLVSYHCKAGGAPRYAKVVLRLDENEVEMALGDKTLLSSIVDDVSCLE